MTASERVPPASSSIPPLLYRPICNFDGPICVGFYLTTGGSLTAIHFVRSERGIRFSSRSNRIVGVFGVALLLHRLESFIGRAVTQNQQKCAVRILSQDFVLFSLRIIGSVCIYQASFTCDAHEIRII